MEGFSLDIYIPDANSKRNDPSQKKHLLPNGLCLHSYFGSVPCTQDTHAIGGSNNQADIIMFKDYIELKRPIDFKPSRQNF